jgi:hypothetical protein
MYFTLETMHEHRQFFKSRKQKPTDALVKDLDANSIELILLGLLFGTRKHFRISIHFLVRGLMRSMVW